VVLAWDVSTGELEFSQQLSQRHPEVAGNVTQIAVFDFGLHGVVCRDSSNPTVGEEDLSV
jgi:hypothetical protein